MKTLITILFLSLLSSPGWSETFDDLVERDGVYYKKFSEVPFSGKITGLVTGNFKNGKRDGAWIGYWNNGQLLFKGNWKKGKEEGEWVGYWNNGHLWWKGNWKNGWREGVWVECWDGGQLLTKGNYKNGKQEGAWVGYNRDRTLNEDGSGIFKNGVKISD